MDLSDPDQREAWRDHLGDLFRDRRVICGIGPHAGFTDWVALLARAGARRPLVVANGTGAGPTPSTDEADVVFLEVPVSDLMTDELRAQDALARDLPADVRAAVEAYDPTGDAIWMVGPFISPEPLLGRPVVGGRPDAWTALEDKLLADEIWDAVGTPRSVAETVRVEADAVRGAADRLDAGAGVVLAGDARDGFNGAGEFVRWVADDDDLAAALDFFGPRCDRLRVMPFLDGVPCSVHGLVLPDGTVAFRPVELAILRGERHRFVYGGQGTTWDPPAEDRASMRQLVRRTGEHLRARVGYRGAFGIDGVLTVDGFRPTELNTRYSGGLATMARVLDPGLFTLLQHNLLADRDVGVTVDEIEDWALPVLDAERVCKAIAVLPDRIGADPFDVAVRYDGRSLTRDAAGTMTVSVGPNPSGTYVRLVTGDGDLAGVRVGHLNTALMEFLDGEMGTRIGAVAAPPDVR